MWREAAELLGGNFMFQTIPKAVYDKMFAILSTDSSLDYIATKQRGFNPKEPDTLVPNLFPWVFIEFGGYSPVEVYAMPKKWDYEFTIAVVAMVLADKGRPEDLVFRSGDYDQGRGIGDVVADIGNVLWGYKDNMFDVVGVLDWTITRVGTPSILAIQQLLMNPYVRGVQMDVSFQLLESSAV